MGQACACDFVEPENELNFNQRMTTNKGKQGGAGEYRARVPSKHNALNLELVDNGKNFRSND